MRLSDLSRGPALALLALPLLLAHGAAAGEPEAAGVSIAALTRKIPAEPGQPLTGSQFAALAADMDPRRREQAILAQLLDGDLPAFLRHLIPVSLSYQPPGGRALTATMFVMPEYLAIGTDQDFLRIPMNLFTAARIATRMGFVLPTRKMVDAIYSQAAVHFSPEPMAPGAQMRSTGYYEIHNEKIEAQSRALGAMPGMLVSGDKKDVVVTNLLARNPGRIAIYGWHRLNGLPIQPLSTVHGACYADYSHGIRLVSEEVLVNGQLRSVYDVLRDPALSGVLSDEGPIPDLRALLERDSGASPCADAAAYFKLFTQRNPR